MTQIDFITKDDFQQFRQEILTEIQTLLKQEKQEPKQWLRSRDVRKMPNKSA